MHRRWRTFLVPAALALGLVAGACGGGTEGGTGGIASAGDGSPAKQTAGAKDKVDPEQAGLDFARCMREHGVDMPDPQAGAGGMVMIGPGPGEAQAGVRVSGPPEGFEEAHEACKHILEDLIGEGPGPLDPAEQDRALEFARCMREHGVDMPDPDFSGGGPRIAIARGPGVGPDSETFKAAQEACGELFGPRGGMGAAPVAASGARS